MSKHINPDLVRINKELAIYLGISRREADDLIKSGRIKINNNTATLGDKVNKTDNIFVDDKKIDRTTKFKYILLNKPVGYVCSKKQQGQNPTIYSLLPKKFQDLKTVGRLDKNSSGLIILTNDGDFSFKMTHPKFYKIKKYEVWLNKDLEPLHQQMINDYGVNLEDGVSQLILEKLDENSRKKWIVTMHEGRNRQIRRTFRALGYEVTRLKRTNFGNYALGDIKPGELIEIKI